MGTYESFDFQKLPILEIQILQRGDILLDLLDPGGSDEGAGDLRTAQHPGKGHLRQGLAPGTGQLVEPPQAPDDGPVRDLPQELPPADRVLEGCA